MASVSAVKPSLATRTWGTYLPGAARIQLVIMMLLVVAVYWVPIRRDLIWRWAHDGNWSHGWLVPLFSLYFLAARRHELFKIRARTDYFGAVIVAGSLTVYFLSVWRFRMHYPQDLSLLGVIFGLALLFSGREAMRILWFPIAFLFFAIPLPQQHFVKLTLPLRIMASKAAAALMPIFKPGLYTDAQAVVIDYVAPGSKPGTLDVEEACSGLRLMMSFMALGVAIAYLRERPRWHRLVMVISCIPIAVICNTVRVTITGLLQVNGYGHLARGTAHQFLGISMLVLAFALFYSLDYVLGNLFREVHDEEDEEDGSAAALT
jgi:exosortase